MYAKDAFANMLTMESDAAFFSCVWPQVADTQPRMILLAPYAPIAKRKQAVYLAPTLRVTHAMMKPMMATIMDTVICQVRSLRLPDEYANRTEAAAAVRYGGHVITKVMVDEKPSVLMTVGKNLR